MSVRAFIVIQSADKDRANALAASTFDRGGSGNRTFSVGLVPTNSPAGTEPTHYVTASLIDDDKWPLIAANAPSFTGSHFESYDLLANPNAPWAYCASVGLQRPATTLP